MFWVNGSSGNGTTFRFFRRHYSAEKNPHPKVRRFVAPGENLTLIGMMCPALFVWVKQQYRKDGQQGVNCAVFRNESPHRSSDMIREAMQLAWERWPRERLFTMVNPRKVRSTNPGYCFLMAGWRKCGRTKRGLVVLECLP